MSTTLTFRVDDQVRAALESLAEATQRSKSFLAAEALKDYLAREAWQVAEIKEGAKQARELGTVSDDEAQAWMTSLGTSKPLRRPRPKKRTKS